MPLEISVPMTRNMESVLRVILKGNRDGSLVDLDQLLSKVDYHCTKQAIQFTLRSMIRRDLIVKSGRINRGGRSRQTYAATEIGYSMLGADKGTRGLNYTELDKLFAEF